MQLKAVFRDRQAGNEWEVTVMEKVEQKLGEHEREDTATQASPSEAECPVCSNGREPKRLAARKPRWHVVELIGYLLLLLVLVGFPLVGHFVPNPEATILDTLLRMSALLGLALFGLGRWVLRPRRPK
jgi:hypothetical protein